MEYFSVSLLGNPLLLRCNHLRVQEQQQRASPVGYLSQYMEGL